MARGANGQVTETIPSKRINSDQVSGLVRLSGFADLALPVEDVNAGTNDNRYPKPGDEIRKVIEKNQSKDGRTDDFDVLKWSENGDHRALIGINHQQVTYSGDESQHGQ